MNGKTITNALALGLATAAVGWGLQKAYKATGYYPSQPVFLIAAGTGAFLVYGAAKKARPLKGLLT